MSAYAYHDDVIKWEHFLRYWPFVRGIQWSLQFPSQSPVMWSFDIFFAWTNGWTNSEVAGDMRHHDVHIISL